MQPWYLRPGWWLFIVLVAASVYSAIRQWRDSGRDRRTEKCVQRVDRMLCTWAEHWGEAPEQVKSLLLKAIEPK